MDDIDDAVARIRRIDFAAPAVDRAAVERALLKHCALIGFREPAMHWVEGPADAAARLAGIDWESDFSRKWVLTLQAMEDAGRLAFERAAGESNTAWQDWRRAQHDAEKQIEAALRDAGPEGIPIAAGDDGRIEEHLHDMPFLVRTSLRDRQAARTLDPAAWPAQHTYIACFEPFIEAFCAGLAGFWTVNEDFICLPLPRMQLLDGVFHCDGGPAILWPDGTEEWYRDGEKVGGPA